MKSSKPCTLKLALIASLVAAPAMSQAALIAPTSTGSFSGTASVTDIETGGATNNNGASLGAATLSKFNSSLGVLTGVQLSLDSTRTQTVHVTSSDGPNTGNNDAKTSTGTGQSTANFKAPGVDYTFSSAISLTDTCAARRQQPCTGTANTSNTTTNVVVGSNALDSYVGTGGVTAAFSAPLLEALQDNGQFTGDEQTKYDLSWQGSLTATYTYLQHAIQSFESAVQRLTLELDFGNVYLGDAATTKSFSIFNIAGMNSVGLDLDAIVPSGSTSIFSTTLGVFSGLGQGMGGSYNATFLANAVGNFSASYALKLSDADVGAAVSRINDLGLTLNLKGNVIERPAPAAAVPEPGALALLGLGMLALLGMRRRRG